MSIKAVEEVPRTKNEEGQSNRQRIRNDIKEAIYKRIPKFEFEGDYNYKNLAQYARKEWMEEFRVNYYRDASIVVSEEVTEKTGSRGVWTTPYYLDLASEIVKFKTRKAEDRIHVFAEINFPRLDNLTQEIRITTYQKYGLLDDAEVKQDAESILE